MKNIWKVLVVVGVVVFVYMLIFDNGTSSQSVSNVPPMVEVESEYGSSLAECMKKANDWYVDAKLTAQSVLADEDRRGIPPSQRSGINDINASLSVEFADYQQECKQRFN